MQVKVTNTVSHKTSQGDVIVAKGKLVFLYTFQILTGKILKSSRPIIISETEKIEEGDVICRAFDYAILRDNINSDNRRGEKFYKVLALSEHFSPKQLQAIVDGKLKDGDEVYVECIKTNFETPAGTVYDTISRIKLNSDIHITLHKVEQQRHYITQEELEILHKIALESNYPIAKYNGAYREGYFDSYNRFKRFLKEE